MFAVSDREITITGLFVGEGGFNVISGSFSVVASRRFNIDLLDLKVVVEGFKFMNVDDERFVIVDVVNIDKVVGLIKDAEDDEILAEKRDGLADNFGVTKEFDGEGATDNGATDVGRVVKKTTRFKRKFMDFDKIGGGTKDRTAFDDFFSGELVIRESDRSDGGKVREFFDSFEVFKVKVAF